MSGPVPLGFLRVDKTPGPTSHDVVDAARRALGVRKGGHTGTLDPFASGLLILCVGQATRLAEYLVGLDKRYEATARLGVATATDDPEGREVSRDDRWHDLTRQRVLEGLAALQGSRLQRPPRYSSVKVDGIPAHRRVRRGETVELEPRPVQVHEITLRHFEPPDVAFEVHCSSGTYIRSLAREAGELWGTACHLTALRRTRVGELSVDGAASWDSLREGRIPTDAWVSPEVALSHLSSLTVDAEGATRLAAGQAIDYGGEDVSRGAVFHQGHLVAVGALQDGVLRPRKVFARG